MVYCVSSFSEPPPHLHIQVGLRTVVYLLIRTGDMVTVEVIRGADFGDDQQMRRDVCGGEEGIADA